MKCKFKILMKHIFYESPISSKNELKKCGLKVSSSQRNAKKMYPNFKILTGFSLGQYPNLDQLFTCEYDEKKKTLSEALLPSICLLTCIIFFAKNRTCIKDLLFCTLTFIKTVLFHLSVTMLYKFALIRASSARESHPVLAIGLAGLGWTIKCTLTFSILFICTTFLARFSAKRPIPTMWFTSKSSRMFFKV